MNAQIFGSYSQLAITGDSVGEEDERKDSSFDDGAFKTTEEKWMTVVVGKMIKDTRTMTMMMIKII